VSISASDTVIVVSGGSIGNEISWRTVPPARYVIAADSGIALAYTLGLRVDEALGDFDSATVVDKKHVSDRGGSVHEYEESKNATDLELALAAAAARRPKRIVVLGGAGGRFDHLIAGTLLLTATTWNDVDATGIQIEAYLGSAKLTVIRDRATLLAERKGELVSLVAIGGIADGVTTAGLHFKLTDEKLSPGSSLGVSNEFTELEAKVRVRQGTLLAIQPGMLGRIYLGGIDAAVSR
jgi:thiamine pyrophosphokinase